MKFFHSSVLFLAFLLVPTISSMAQYFSVGTDPASLKWSQIKTDNYRFLFPREAKPSAGEFTQLLDKGLDNIGASLKHKPRKFPLILHPYSSTSNGYTIWAPRRIELFPRPPRNGGAESYADHLLIHEVRHMVQMDKLHVGITRWASWLLGEQATAVVIGLHMPNWLSEGDAVLTETLLTNSGRGRQALFTEAVRAQWLSGYDFSLDQALFGSYKRFIPNHYVTGYLMVSTARLLGGSYVWEGALDKMGRRPYTISLLSRYLKKEIGYNKSELFGKTKEWAGNYWRSSIPEPVNSPELMFTKDTGDYVNYIKPQKLDNGLYVGLKESLASIPEFVMFSTSGVEKHLAYPAYMDEGAFSCAGDYLVWAEENPDKRWSNRSFSNLYLLNLKTGQKRRISKKTRYYSPELTVDGQKIACLESTVDGSNNLTILETATGEITDQVTAPEGEVFQMPVWDSDANIWMCSTGRSGKKVYKYNPKNQHLTSVTNLGFKEVFNFIPWKNGLLLLGPNRSVNSVFFLSFESEDIYLVSADTLGINHLSVRNGEINASVYRINGYKPASIKFSLENRVPFIADLDEPYLPLMTRAENEVPIEIADTVSTPAKKYRKAFHLFRFHSWAPASLDLSQYSLLPGVMLLSQNDLSTTTAQLGLEYNISYKRWEQFASLHHEALPVKMDLGFRSYADIRPLGDVNQDISYRTYQSSLRLSYPINLSSGRWFRRLTPALLVNYFYYSGNEIETGNPYEKSLVHTGLGLGYHSLSRMSSRDLYPRWGMVTQITSINQADFLDGSGKTYLAASLQAYLPGFFQNHSTRFYAAGSLNNDWIVPDQSSLLLPRGMYNGFARYNSSAKMDYAFPFWYPDWNLGSLLYVKRLKANGFVDMAKNLGDSHEFFMSVGLDLTSDFYFFRIGAEIDAGLRGIYNITENKPGLEILFNFSIE